jgi:hypothetical protein
MSDAPSKPNPIFVSIWGTLPLDQVVWAKPKRDTTDVIVVRFHSYAIEEFTVPGGVDREEALIELGKAWKEFKKN